MSATLYDTALMNKINQWTEKSKLKVFGPTEARERLAILADENDDKSLKLPFLIISRPDGYVIQNTLKTPLSYNGKRYRADNDSPVAEDEKIVTVNAIPITLTYQIDVYTRYEQEADAYMRELIFNFVNYPAIDVVLPYLNMGVSHQSTVRFSSDIVQINKGPVSIKTDQVFNYGIEIKIDDAYIWDMRTKDPVSIDVTSEDFVVSYPNPNNTITAEYVIGGIKDSENIGDIDL